MPKLGRLVKDLGMEWGGLEGIFHNLRNMPTSRAARNEHWVVRVLVGSNRKPHIFLIPVEKCLDSRPCFCFKLVSVVWLAK